MSDNTERNLGVQPIADIMAALDLNPHDLVAASTEQLTHKMVTRAMKGRRLTPHMQLKVLNALNNVVGKNYSLKDLFTYWIKGSNKGVKSRLDDMFQGDSMGKIKLDLHDIYNKGKSIDAELARVINEAIDKGIALVEIIPGKGSGQLKKKVLRFLDQKHIRTLYHRVEKDSKNWGRLFIHFKKN